MHTIYTISLSSHPKWPPFLLIHEGLNKWLAVVILYCDLTQSSIFYHLWKYTMNILRLLLKTDAIFADYGILLVCGLRVNKPSFIKRYGKEPFDNTYTSTVYIGFWTKAVNIYTKWVRSIAGNLWEHKIPVFDSKTLWRHRGAIVSLMLQQVILWQSNLLSG